MLSKLPIKSKDFLCAGVSLRERGTIRGQPAPKAHQIPLRHLEVRQIDDGLHSSIWNGDAVHSRIGSKYTIKVHVFTVGRPAEETGNVGRQLLPLAGGEIEQH